MAFQGNGDCMRMELASKARELFSECDKEQKGFILKKDLEKFKDELNLSVEQLAEVFDALDKDGNGFLTLEEFTEGFGLFVGPFRPSESTHATTNGTLTSSPTEDQFDDLLTSLDAHDLFPDEDQVRKVWYHLQKEDVTMLSHYEAFLSKITNEMKKSQMEYTSLENALKNRETEHGAHLQHLYQELDQQIAAEKEHAMEKEKCKERKLREELEKELSQRDILLSDLMKRQKKLEKRLEALRSRDCEEKLATSQLRQEKEELETRLSQYHHTVTELQQSVDRIHQSTLEESTRRTLAVVQASENMALERDELIQQLEILRDINRRLMDEKDEAMSRRSWEEWSDSSNDAPVKQRSIRESIAAVTPTWRHPLEQEELAVPNDLNAKPPFLEDTQCSSISDNEKEFSDSEDGFAGRRSVRRRHSKLLSPLLSQSLNSLSKSPKKENSSQGLRSSLESSPQKESQITQLRKKTPERLFKVIIIGDSGVGKTSFLQRFCNNTFRPTFRTTVGVDFYVRTLDVEDGRTIVLQLWDTAGQEKFLSVTKQYFRKADGVVVVYDTTSETTFKNVRNWLACIKDNGEDKMVQLLVGNKIDLCEYEDDRVVRPKDGARLADEVGALFFETSSKTGEGVEEAMKTMAGLLQEKEDEEMEKVLRLQESMRRKRCC